MRPARPWAILFGLLVACGAPVPAGTTGQPPTPPSTALSSVPAADPISSAEEEPPGCDSPVPFRYSLVDLDAIEYITPLGLMVDSHVTPVDHVYFQNFVDPDRWIDVFAPADGVVTSIQHFGSVISEEATPIDDYRLVVDHGCGITTILIHIDELDEALLAVAPERGAHATVAIPVVAGAHIGRFTANLDLTVVDESVRIKGLIDEATYAAEPWKVHTPDPFAYFDEPIRLRMEELSLREGPPYAGTFAWDIDGRLVGNWFEEGTGGYGGSNPERYWAGHLSFAYDHIDHTTIIVSIGTFAGRSEQLAVLGNAPDPSTVGADDGVVRYELVDWDYWVGDERWNRMELVKGIEARPGSRIAGTILVQLIDDRALLFEAFPGIVAADVDGFTGAAVRYER